jgi:hypothetical protein
MMTFLKSLRVVTKIPSVMPSITLSTTKVSSIKKTLLMVEIITQEVEIIIQGVVTTQAAATTILEIMALTRIAPAQIITQRATNAKKMTVTMSAPVKRMIATMNVESMIVPAVIVMCMIAVMNVRSKSAVTVSANHVKTMNAVTERTVAVVNVLPVRIAKTQIAMTQKDAETLTVRIVMMYTGAIILIAHIAMTATIQKAAEILTVQTVMI